MVFNYDQPQPPQINCYKILCARKTTATLAKKNEKMEKNEKKIFNEKKIEKQRKIEKIKKMKQKILKTEKCLIFVKVIRFFTSPWRLFGV